MKMKFATIILFLTAFAAFFLALPLQGGTPGAEVKPLSEAILKHGMEDGAIRMMSTDQTVWINPYFTNLALYALLRASESAPELKEDVFHTIEKWFEWYAAHQLPDGTITDYSGYLDRYESTGKFDSTDSYAATYLVVADQYMKLSGKALSDAAADSARKAYAAMISTMDEDGLTWAHANYKAKYLMDNLEVNQGLNAAVDLFKRLGDSDSAADAERRLALNSKGLDKFFLKDKNYLAWALTENDVVHESFEKFYPDFLANAFACSMLDGLNPRYWEKLSTQRQVFAENFCARAYPGALRFGDRETADAIRSAMEKHVAATADPSTIRLDILTLLLGISLNDPDFWPETPELSTESPLR